MPEVSVGANEPYVCEERGLATQSYLSKRDLLIGQKRPSNTFIPEVCVGANQPYVCEERGLKET